MHGENLKLFDEILSEVYIGLYSFQILMKLAFSIPLFEKYSNITFHEHSSNGSWAVPYGQTDGRNDIHDESNSSLSQFCLRGAKYKTANKTTHNSKTRFFRNMILCRPQVAPDVSKYRSSFILRVKQSSLISQRVFIPQNEFMLALIKETYTI